jgi:hypothetical protein
MKPAPTASVIPAPLMGASAQVGRIIDEGISALLAIHKDSVFVGWDGCIPWKTEAGEALPGAVGLLRRVGKPYEYERGEVKVRGHDTFVIMRTRDVLDGGLRAQAIVTVTSRGNPAEPPVKYKVRMIDEMGDTNAHVYLLDIGQGAEPDMDVGPSGDSEPGPGAPTDNLPLSPSERRKLSRWR